MLLLISQKASWSGRSSSQSYQPVSSSSPSSSWSWWSTRSGGFLRDPLHGSQTCFSSLFLFSPCWFQSWGFLFISPRKVYTIHNTKQINFIRICWGLYRGTCCNSHLHSCTKFQHTTRGNKQNRHLPDKTRKLPKPKMAQTCSVPAVCVRAVDCWQWRSGHYNHQTFQCCAILYNIVKFCLILFKWLFQLPLFWVVIIFLWYCPLLLRIVKLGSKAYH